MLQPNPIQPNPERPAAAVVPEALSTQTVELRPEGPLPTHSELSESPVSTEREATPVQEVVVTEPPTPEMPQVVEPPLANQRELDKEYVDRVEEAREDLRDKPAEFKEKFDEIGQHYLDERFGKELQKSED